jgi:IS5 family transposase
MAVRRHHSVFHVLTGGLTEVGYQAHVTETGDEDVPQLIPHVVTTPARTYARPGVEPMHAGVHERDLMPAAHARDAGYLATPRMVERKPTIGVALLGPVLGFAGLELAS